MTYERHPLSASWPDMADEDFTALKDSISYSGLLEPITLFDGQILDGWHRYGACLETGMEPRFEEFTGDDPAQYVRDKHTRRPLTLTQRLTCIALMSRWRPNGGKQSAVPADCFSSKDIAKAAGGGVRSAEHVKEAITKGAPELVQAMKAGKVGAEKAAAIAKLPQAEQAAAIHKPTPKPPPPAPVVEPDSEAPPDDDGPSEEELAINAAAEAADRALMATLLDSDAPLAALAEENKQLKAEIAQLKLARDGYMNRCNEAIALVKARDRQIAKLEKMMKVSA